MGETSIEWCDYTFNPWIGCSKVSDGCKNCYAEKDTYSRVSKSRGLPLWGPKAERHRTSKANWRKPLAWNRNAVLAEMRKTLSDMAPPERYRRPKVFCASLADVFEDHPLLAEWRADLWKLIEACPELDWLLLTKRPENVLGMVPQEWLGGVLPSDDTDSARRECWKWQTWTEAGKLVHGIRSYWPGHVFVGTSVEDQRAADERIPHLLRVPAPVRFLSCEPLVGPVDLERYFSVYDSHGEPSGPRCKSDGSGAIDWVIVGGESGSKARPMHPNWARSIRDQCQEAGVPFFFKQNGGWAVETPRVGGDLGGDMRRGVVQIVKMLGENDGHARAGDVFMRRIGKKAAGRLLDGRTWDEMPETRP